MPAHASRVAVAILSAAALATAAVAADPPPSPDPAELPAAGQVESAALFKNGLAIVRRVVHLPGPGTYRLDDMPAAPVHGTFWVESDLPIDTRVTTRDVPRGRRRRANTEQHPPAVSVDVR